MTSKDSITIVMLILGLVWVTVVVVLMKLGKIKLEMWPPTLAIGAGVYVFAASMIESLMLRPTSELMDYTITNLLSALVFGILGYFGGRIILRNAKHKKR